MKYTEINKQAYDTLALEYVKRHKHKTEYEEPLDILIGKPLEHAKQRFREIHALDLGPGSGEVTRYLAEHRCKTTALDISEIVLRNIEFLPTTEVINTDILRYSLEKEKYNLVCCGAFIHLFSLKDAAKVLQNIYSSLIWGGILLINTTLHDKSSEGFYTKKDYTIEVKRFRHRYTEQEFRKLVEHNGFNIIDEIPTDEKDRDKKWMAYVAEKI